MQKQSTQNPSVAATGHDLVEVRIKSRRVGHLYVVPSDCGTLVKIGRSVRPDARVRSIQTQGGITGIHAPVISKPLRGYDQLESHLHRCFADFRITGEWFRLNLEDAARALRAIEERFLAVEADFSMEKEREDDAIKGAGRFAESIVGSTMSAIASMQDDNESNAIACAIHGACAAIMVMRESGFEITPGQELVMLDSSLKHMPRYPETIVGCFHALLPEGGDEERAAFFVSIAMDAPSVLETVLANSSLAQSRSDGPGDAEAGRLTQQAASGRLCFAWRISHSNPRLARA